MAQVQNLVVTPRPQGLDASWDLPNVSFPERMAGLRWEVRDGAAPNTLRSSQEWPRVRDRIWRWADSPSYASQSGLITEDGHAYWWGEVRHHFTGTAPASLSTAIQSTPVKIGLDNVVGMVHGLRHTLLLRSDGSVWGYGMATRGELGGGTLTRNVPYTAPVLLASASVGAIQIAISRQATFVLTDSGNVLSWGQGGYIGGRGSASADTSVASTILSGVWELAANQYGGIAWAPNHGTPGLYAWGYSDNEHAGVIDVFRPHYALPIQNAPDGIGYGIPTRSTIPDSNFMAAGVAQISTFGGGGFIRTPSGVLYPWGNNNKGIFGLGTGNDVRGLQRFSMSMKVTGPWDYVQANGGSGTLALRYNVISNNHAVTLVAGAYSSYNPPEGHMPGHPGDGYFRTLATIPGGTPPAGMQVVGSAHYHSYWVNNFETGSAVSYGDDVGGDYGLLGQNPLVQPTPHVAIPTEYKRRNDLPTSFSLPTGLQVNTNYDVTVRVDDGDGTSDTVSASATTLAGYTAPEVTVTPGDRELSLSWTAGDSGDPITNYQVRVYRGGSLVFDEDVGNVLSHTVTGLLNATEHEVWVRGTNGSEELTWGIASGTPDRVPTAPTNPQATIAIGAGVNLSWTAPDSHPNEGQLVGYQVQMFYYSEVIGTGNRIVDLPAGVHQNYLLPMAAFYDGGLFEEALAVEAEWAFHLRAVSSAGEGAWSLSTNQGGQNLVGLKDYPAVPEQFRLVDSEERLTLAWNTPLRANYTGFRLQYRPYGDNTWTVRQLPSSDRTAVISGLDKGVLYEIQLISTSSDLESAPVTLQAMLREPEAPSITFQGSGAELTLPDPNSADLQIPGTVSPMLTQAGFFLPVQAIDDMEASWSMSWNSLPQRLISTLETLQGLGTLTMTDPLNLVTFGYVENVDYEGVPGAIDRDTGEALYRASLEFKVIRMQMPALLGALPDGEHELGRRFGVSDLGVPPLSVGGDAGTSGEVEEGWFLTDGGEAGPWADSITPSGESWDRPTRTPPSVPGPVDPGEPEPITNWPARWLELDASTLPPSQGTVFLGIRPLVADGVPLEFVDDTISESEISSAPGAYYAYWDAEDRDTVVDSIGPCTIRHELVYLDVPQAEYLPMGVRFTLLDPEGKTSLRYRQEFVVATRYLEHLPESATIVGRDSDGQPRPGPGVYLKKDLRRLDGSLVYRRYIPASRRYDSRDLFPTSEAQNARVHIMATLAESLRTQISGGYTHPYGASLTADSDALFGWLDRGTPGDFTLLDIPWSPGRAGPYERVLMGSGERHTAGWLVYAIDRSLVVEFWRDNTLVLSRQLDLSALTDDAQTGDRYLIAMGYDFTRGSVALGVSRRGAQPKHVYRKWSSTALVGHGYRNPTLYLGGVPVEHSNGSTYSKSCWSWVRPVDGGFTHEGLLTPGRLASLMEYLP